MDRIACAHNNNNNASAWNIQPPQAQQEREGIAELKNRLVWTSRELERTRAHAETLIQFHQARMLELQELLTVTSRERDEARELLAKLTNNLEEIKHHPVMSRDLSAQWPNTSLAGPGLDELNPCITTAAAAAMHCNSSQLVGLDDQLRWNSDGHDFDTSHLDLPQLDIDLQLPTSSSKIHCSNPNELQLQEQEQPFYHQNEQQQSLTVKQQEPELQHQVESQLPPLVEDKSTDCEFWQHQQQQEATGIRQTSNRFLEIGEPSASGHMTYHDQKPGLELAPPRFTLGTNSAAMPTHLPEPPEANLQVMLRTLPERGKLLQAVMQAGPLLQTLLLSGPLPQWRCPPPVLDTRDIPKVPVNPSINSRPVGPMVNHLPNPISPTLQANSHVFPSHQNLGKRTRINEPPTTFITTQQSALAAPSNSSKLLCTQMINQQMINQQDSVITAGLPPKFVNRQMVGLQYAPSSSTFNAATAGL